MCWTCENGSELFRFMGLQHIASFLKAIHKRKLKVSLSSAIAAGMRHWHTRLGYDKLRESTMQSSATATAVAVIYICIYMYLSCWNMDSLGANQYIAILSHSWPVVTGGTHRRNS